MLSRRLETAYDSVVSVWWLIRCYDAVWEMDTGL